MLLRIRQRPRGSIDGIRIDDFRVGEIYDLGPQLSAVFLAEGWAEPVASCSSLALSADLPAVILVVEDHDDMRQFTKALLTQQGYDVVEAHHGQEAMARLREYVPDLVVLDLNMPVMDGWAFRNAQQRLTDRRLASVPVLVVTATDIEDDRRVPALRAAGVLKKPFDPERLLSAVDRALHHPRAGVHR